MMSVERVHYSTVLVVAFLCIAFLRPFGFLRMHYYFI